MSSVFSPTESPPTGSAAARSTIGSAGKRPIVSRGPATPSRVVRGSNHSAPAQLYQLSDAPGNSRQMSLGGIGDDDEIVDETVDGVVVQRRASKTGSPPPRQVTAAVAAYSSSSSSPSRSRSVSPTTTPPSQFITPAASVQQPQPLQQAPPAAAPGSNSKPSRERPPLMSSHDVEAPASPDPETDARRNRSDDRSATQATVPANKPTASSVGRPAPSDRQPQQASVPAMPPTAASAVLPTTPPRVTLGKKELIGAGSFGSVYKALDMETNCTIAVKEIRLQFLESSPQAQKELAALEREIKVMQKLSHPNIVKYLGYTWGEGTFNIHMEFVPCGTIASLLRTFGPLSPMQAALFTKQILAGLEYLHEKNIIHRDLKGDNLFVNTDGTLKVGDFGTAKELQTVRQSNSVAGTPYFMAPEVVRNGGHGLEADVWSVGCCVIQMLSGQPPYRSFDNQLTVMYQVSKGDIEPHIPKDAPDDAKDFIRACCKFKPKDRPTVPQLLQHPWLLAAPPVAGAAQRISSSPPPPFAPRSTPPATAAASAPRNSAASPPGEAAAARRSTPPTSSVDATPRNGTPVSENITPPPPPPPPPAAAGTRGTEGGGSASRGVAAARAARRNQPEERPHGAGGGRRAATPVKKPVG